MTALFSHGKILLTSEYLVLDGAIALAIPTKMGQDFRCEVRNDGKNQLHWVAFHVGKPWLTLVMDYKTSAIISTNLPEATGFILNLIQKTVELSTHLFKEKKSYFIKTNLQFPPDFGLGSSSTLMVNVAEWAGIDAFKLNDEVLGGSGYDIAVAKEGAGVLFWIENGKRFYQPQHFRPSFTDDLLLIHLNKKQDSREGIRLYQAKEKNPKLIEIFSELTKNIINAESIEHFERLMVAHELQLSNFLGLKTVKKQYFEDCPVFVKSLGAWGGDFALTRKFDNYQNYFLNKGFSKLYHWNELII